MVSDRFVVCDPWPATPDVGAALLAYVGAAGTVEWSADHARWFVTLPGAPSAPWSRPTMADDVRAFEVFYDPGPDAPQFDVMTRHADPLTCAVADGFARCVALRWGTAAERARWASVPCPHVVSSPP